MRREIPRIFSLGLALVALLVVLLPIACHAPASSALARVRAAGVLKWGGDVQGGEPYVFDDPAHPGKLIGFEVELADLIARDLGVRQQFVQNDWSNLVPSLERGSFDMIMNGLEITPSRAGRVLFTRPYFIYGMRLMARKNDPSITGLSSLRSRRVGSLANSQSWDALVRVGANPLPYEGVEEPYIDLEGGRTDAVLLDDIIANRYGVPRDSLRVVGDVGEGYYAIAVRRGEDDLRTAIDASLARIAASGKLREILQRWNIDGDREETLVHWTDAQTQTLVRTTETITFGWFHIKLFLRGALVTMLVSVGAMLLAVPLGMALALARLYGPRPLGVFAATYVEIFRGTPVLLQLYVIYYGLAGVLNLDAFTAAILGLGLNYGSYEAEVYRAGIQAVPRGQMEAAVSLGMSTPLALRRIVMPQAFRLALPSVTNDFIALLKDSSLVSVITVVELTKRMTITAVDTRSWLVPGAVCALMYFLMSYPLSRLARRLEEKLARS